MGKQESVASPAENKEKTPFKLNLESTVQRKTPKKKDNWYSKYIAAERKDRVKWKSKLYRMEKSMWEKPLDEQAEHLMDESAEQFAKWVNSLGSKSGKEMTKDELKSLFAIERNKCLLSSIQINPRVVRALPRKVADKWNMPEMAIELKYENYVNAQLKNAPRKDKTVSFGLTIPFKNRPWMQSMEDMTIETIFPEELRSGEHLFQGIVHLRSTKALIERCKKKPNIRRPKYLVDNGYFKATSKRTSDAEEPLYELLKIKFKD